MKRFHFTLVTPDGPVYQNEVTSVTAPGREGYVGIWAHHAHILTAIKPGVLNVTAPGEVDMVFAIGSGVLEVSDKEVVVLADGAEEAATLQEAHEKVGALE